MHPRVYLCAAVLAGLFNIYCSQPVCGYQVPAETDIIFRQADRELRQALVRAERAIEQGEYADAVDEIGKLLAENTTDDYFLSAAEQRETRTSLKAEAERLLGILPQRGRDLYELKFGTEARVLLEAGLQEANVGKLTEVVRRYFHTKAGVEAAILLGRLQLDRGQSLAAALLFRRVMSVPGSNAYDPELSLLLAVAWHQAQRPNDAKAVLARLTARGPVKIAANQGPLQLDPNDDANAWLNKIVGLARPAGDRPREEWCVFGGNEQRNASVVGGRPLTDFRWKTAFDLRDAPLIRDIKSRMKESHFGHLPSTQPLAIGDSILMRGAERMWAVNVPTGKIMWEYPWDESERERQQRTSQVSNSSNKELFRRQELQQRLFEDYAYGQLSSDGETVYLLDDLRVVPTAGERRMIVVGGRIVPNATATTTHNQMVALELNKQGKLKWIIGGERGNDEPKLTDHFFLGAPLPLMGQLLTLAECDGEIRLVVVDAATGQLEWSQQVAHMNEASIRFDSLRRLAGATPSFSEGLVICPTTGGAVVAVDWTKRSLAWGYSYKRSGAPILQQRFGVFQMNVDNSPGATPTRWTNSAAVIADGVVVVTPPDSNELHCLDLITGKPVWPPRERTNTLAGMQYVGCIHDGKIIVVGKRGLTAVNLKDGTDAWTIAFDPLAYGPSGRGIYSQPNYWVPLVNGELLKIDLEAGKIVDKLATEMPLGNIIVHKGEIVSLGPDYLTTYYLRDFVEKQADEVLKKSPEDPWALARKGEIALQDGKQAEGLQLLRAAYRLRPQDDTIRTRLLKTLLVSLSEDQTKYSALVSEIEPLILDLPERADFLRRTAEVLLRKGAQREAFENYLALSALTAQLARHGSDANSLDELQPGWRVRSDRWLYSRLAAIYAKSDDAGRKYLDNAVAQRIGQANLTPVQRQAMISLFGFHPETYRARLSSAEKGIEGRGLLAAELELTPLLTNGSPETRALATSLMAKLTETADRNLEAAWWLNRLGKEFADVVVKEGETGKTVQTAALAREKLAREFVKDWPGGKVVVDISGEGNSRIPSYQQLRSIPLVSQQGAVGPGQQAVLDTSRSAIVIRDVLGRQIAEHPVNREGGRSYYQFTQGAMYGHLMILTTGTEVLAIDTLQRNAANTGSDSALWRHETSDGPNRNGYVQTRTIRNPFGRPKQAAYDQQNKLLSTTVSVGPWGVAFIRSRTLVCVHPLTGEVIWERAGFESGTDIISDERQLYVIPSGSEEAQVLDAWDGAKLGQIRVPKYENRLYSYNGNLLSWSETPTESHLELRQLAKDQVIWAQAFMPGSHACPISGEEIAVLQPNGQLVIVSLTDGRTRLHVKMEIEPTLLGLHVQRTQDRYFVISHHPTIEPTPRTNFTPGLASQAVMITGRIHAFDRETRKPAWPAPVYIHQQGYIAEQPPELPVLMFVRSATGTKTITSLLCIDKRTGAVLLDKGDMPTSIHAYEMIGNREKNQVGITLYGSSQRTFTLTFTDEPTPPVPPAQMGPMSSQSVGALPGKGVNVAGAVLDAINNAASPKKPAADPFQDPFK